MAASSNRTGRTSSSVCGSAGSRGARSPPVAGKGTSRSSRPSDRLNPRTVDPFNDSPKTQSSFATVYANGGVPCRLVHGSVKHKLCWEIAPDQVPFDPVLVTLAEGLKEIVHPYTFVARVGFKELLETTDAANRVIPLLPKIAPSLRASLSHNDQSVFEGGMEALVQLSNVVGSALNPYLKTLLMALSKRMMEKKYKEKVMDTLQQLEQNGGRDSVAIIKSKVPTYCSVYG